MSAAVATDEAARARGGQRGVLFILVTVALDAVGNGILIPVMPRLIIDLGHSGLGDAAVLAGWLMATFALVQFFAAPVLGSLSDAVGRRPVLLTSLAAYGASFVLMAFAPHLLWLFVAQVLTGLFGATPSAAGAYLADISGPHERTARFGQMGAAFGVGVIAGPVIGGLLIGYGLKVPFLAAAALAFANVIYGSLVLPESLPPALRRAFSWARAHPAGVFGATRQLPVVRRALWVTLLQRISATTLPATWPFFAMLSFGWSARDVGMSLAAFGATTVLYQVLLLKRLERWLGTRKLTFASIAVMVVGYLIFAFVPVRWIQLASIPLAAMGYVALVGLNSIASQAVGADRQGWVQGALASVNGLAAVIAPLLMPWLFGVFTRANAPAHFPGAPYFAAAALSIVAMWLLFRLKPASPLK